MKVVITGAAGFVGTNLSLSLKDEHELFLLDNFSRQGSINNGQLLSGFNLDIAKIDISDQANLNQFLDKVGRFDFLIHLAAQTSLIESFKHPKLDFNTNALGTLNILEFLRNYNPGARGIFLASNKVYGNLSQFDYIETDMRYKVSNGPSAFNETLPISPIGGYSISKSILDSYVIEYGKRYSLPVISLRQSAIYGQNQNARTDQGWVSYFIDQFLSNSEKVKLRGKGKQVRDVLYIDDFCSLIKNLFESDIPYGEAYNVGGGHDFSLSILELFSILKKLTNKSISFESGLMALEDQKYFVSNNSKISNLANWKPYTTPEEGIEKVIKLS
jgi:CDP-paratose 2-epimerase